MLADLNCKDTGSALRTDLPGPATDVSNMVTDSHRKASPLRPAPHETHTVALEKNNWRVPESLEKVIPISKSLHPHLKWWLQEVNVLQGQPLHRLSCSPNFYRCINIRGTYCKGNLVPSRQLVAHKLYGTKGGLLGPKKVPRPLLEPNRSHSYRQHHSGRLHK